MKNNPEDEILVHVEETADYEQNSEDSDIAERFPFLQFKDIGMTVTIAGRREDLREFYMDDHDDEEFFEQWVKDHCVSTGSWRTLEEWTEVNA